MGEGDDHTISDTADNQHRLWFPYGDVGNESFGALFSDFSVRPRRFGLQLQWVVGEHRTSEA